MATYPAKRCGRSGTVRAAFFALATFGLLSALMGLLSLTVPVAEAAGWEARRMVSCKLPDRLVKMGQHAYSTRPGPVQRVEQGACERMGGTYFLNACEEIKLLEGPAQGGQASAMVQLARALETEGEAECPPRFDAAAGWYEKAAKAGDKSAAMALARLLSTGRSNLSADPRQARRWLSAAVGLELEGGDGGNAWPEVEKLRGRVRQLEEQIEALERERAKTPSPQAATALENARGQYAALAADYERALERVDAPNLLTLPAESGRELRLVMLDPPLLETRSVQTAAVLISGTEESRLAYEVVGRVLAPRELLPEVKVRVNGSAVRQIEEGGFFRQTVPLAARTRAVKVEASASGMAPATQQFRLEFGKEMPARQPDAGMAGLLKGRSYALVIGISNYNEARAKAAAAKRWWPDLANARNDAKMLGDLLHAAYGFEVEALIDQDATHERILSALIALRDRVKPEDQVLIYYAGHGEIDRASTRGYWIPYDAWNQAGLGPKWIQAEQITNHLEAIPARQVMLVSDSCYPAALNPAIAEPRNALSERSRGRAMAALAGRQARILMTSGSFAPVPDRGKGGNSLFTGALLDSLRKNAGVVLGRDLFHRTESLVLMRARELALNVNPQYGGLDGVGHLGGDFLFRRVA